MRLGVGLHYTDCVDCMPHAGNIGYAPMWAVVRIIGVVTSVLNRPPVVVL